MTEELFPTDQPCHHGRTPTQCPFCHTRSTHPETSMAAARSATRFANSHAGIVHNALTRFGPMTQTEIAEHCDLDRHQIHKRTPDLERAGKARKTGMTRPNATGHQETVWEAL